MLPRFSILTPTLNPGRALRLIAEALAAQTAVPVEWIIKDAGSTDGSLDGISLPPPHSVRILQQPDDGIYFALNAALDVAQGQYIQVLPAGDTFAGPQTLPEVSRIISRSGYPDLVYCHARHLGSGTEWTHPPRLTRWFLFRGTICHQAQFWSRRIYRNERFDTTLRVAADREFLVRVATQHGPLRTVRADHSCVNYAGGGFSETPENAGRLAAEIEVIRQRHFSAGERRFYRLLYGSTAPGLRARWNDRDSPNRLVQLYQLTRRRVRRWM
jgi:glycosyltransferase involved in cell wall biosynthesis